MPRAKSLKWLESTSHAKMLTDTCKPDAPAACSCQIHPGVAPPSRPLPFGSPSSGPLRRLGEAITTSLSRPGPDRHPALIVPLSEIIQCGPPDPSALAGVQVLSAEHVWILQRLFVCLTAYGQPHGQCRAGLRRNPLRMVPCGVSAAPLPRPAPSLRSGASAQPHTLALSPSVCIGFAASLDERRRIAEHNLCGP